LAGAAPREPQDLAVRHAIMIGAMPWGIKDHECPAEPPAGAPAGHLPCMWD
jgi:hypothetical protein